MRTKRCGFAFASLVLIIVHTVHGMAKLLKIGAAVTARVDKVIGSRTAAARYGKNSKAKRVTGTITATNGRGRSRKMGCFFPYLEQAYIVFISFTRNG